MTNILKNKVYVPPGVDLTFLEQNLNLKTNTENISIKFPHSTKFVYEDRYLGVYSFKKRNCSALYGCLLRKLKKLVYGLIIPHQVRLDLLGRGYTMLLQDNKIILQLGHSHDIVLDVPSTVNILIINKKATQLLLSSYSLEDLTQFASKVINFRKPNPYHGRGIIWLGKPFRRKELKKKNN